MKYWQKDLLRNLISYLESDEDVLGLLLFGSYSQPEYRPDYWSDIDILVIVQDHMLDKFFPATEWIRSLGKVYTYSQSSDDFKCTIRVCFENLNRIDFVITTESNLGEISNWSGTPFFSGLKVIFSRSKVVEKIAVQKYGTQEIPAIKDEQFTQMIRDFRFKSMLAVYKVVRDDLLIAMHLGQDLIRDCIVLGLILRNRASGTNIHKSGGMGNQLVTQLERAQKPFTHFGILESIRESNIIFEKLACEWSESYRENRQPMLDWIERAKYELRLQDKSN